MVAPRSMLSGTALRGPVTSLRKVGSPGAPATPPTRKDFRACHGRKRSAERDGPETVDT
ncbi:hypothetical protein [Actinopolyspora saharensis]|uniref:hypothetical protein n=1 Tax=Actinopolyspora saharensis TaxID=995062 RepID=UPI003F66962A